MVAKTHHEGRKADEMTRSEAYRQMYGSMPNMKAVLEQRRAIAEEAMATIERLRQRLCERFPPVDSAGAALNVTFETDLWALKYKLKQIDEAIAECEPKAVVRTKDSTKAAHAERSRSRRNP